MLEKLKNNFKSLVSDKCFYVIAFIIVVLASCLIIYLTFVKRSINNDDLTSEEKETIREYVKNTDVEHAVGQLLMVGVPADYKNYKDIEYINELFSVMGIGNVIVNGYNYYNNNNKYDDITYLNTVIEFNNAIQEKAIRSDLSLPLLIAADFESSSFSSIKHGLILPPSALAIAACQDANLTYLNGRLAGLQLRNIGIHAILGPVLDTYNVKQASRSTLQDRCFSSTLPGVVAISSHFIKGLKEGGVVIFGKHFPSHGMVGENPHDMVIPEYRGTLDQLDAEIKPFSQYFAVTLDGIMTSHISLGRLQNRLATFSQEYISQHLRAMGFNRQIIMTDDLTSMGAIKKYSQESKDGFVNLALKAFDAGQDILLFSHFSEIDKRSTFSMKDIRNIRIALINHIRNSEIADKHFRDSLTRVISIKAKISKSNGVSVKSLLNNQNKSPIFRVQYEGKEALSKSHDFLQSYDEKINTGKKLTKETIRRSITLINKTPTSANYDLSSHPESLKIVVYAYEHGLERFQQTIKSRFQNSEFITIPSEKNSKQFREIEKTIAGKFDNSDIVIYTVFDSRDSSLLSSLRNTKKLFFEKTVIFCHNSPNIFDDEILRKATVLSTFTNNQLSYEIDTEVLCDDLIPRSIENLPISIGTNGEIYNVTNSTFVKPTDISAYEGLFPKYQVDKRTVELLKSDFYMIPRVPVKKIFFVLFNIILISLILFVFAKGLNEVRCGRENLWHGILKILTGISIQYPYVYMFFIFLIAGNLIFLKNQLKYTFPFYAQFLSYFGL